jgi:opacity protein-like surface antigen
MFSRMLLAGAVAAALLVPAANAATVVNTDSAAHKIVFTPKGGKAHSYTLAAHHHRSLDCKAGGTVAIGKDSTSCDAKTAKVLIKGGKFVM